jgi:hypothetical protein
VCVCARCKVQFKEKNGVKKIKCDERKKEVWNGQKRSLPRFVAMITILQNAINYSQSMQVLRCVCVSF